MSKELVISAASHERRVAILEEGQLVEIYIEREKEFALVGSIYKGRVTRVLPGMQSAFVDIGLDGDAFLYVSDVFENLEDYDHGHGHAEPHASAPSPISVTVHAEVLPGETLGHSAEQSERTTQLIPICEAEAPCTTRTTTKCITSRHEHASCEACARRTCFGRRRTSRCRAGGAFATPTRNPKSANRNRTPLLLRISAITTIPRRNILRARIAVVHRAMIAAARTSVVAIKVAIGGPRRRSRTVVVAAGDAAVDGARRTSIRASRPNRRTQSCRRRNTLRLKAATSNAPTIPAADTTSAANSLADSNRAVTTSRL